MSAPASRASASAATPANDNVPGTITPDDRPFFLALTLICAVILALVAYVALGAVPEDDVMTVLRR